MVAIFTVFAITWTSGVLADTSKEEAGISCPTKPNIDTGLVSFIQRVATVGAINVSESSSEGAGKPIVLAQSGNIQHRDGSAAQERSNDTPMAQLPFSTSAAVEALERYIDDGWDNSHGIGDYSQNFPPHNFLPIESGQSHDLMANRNFWNATDTWVNFTILHPTGVISNVHKGRVVWADVNFINIYALVNLSMLAYPLCFIPFALCGAVIVGMCLQKVDGSSSESPGPPAVPTSELTPFSKVIYHIWCKLCCCIPSMLVFGVPMVLIYLSYSMPQEVYVIMLITSSAFVFSNGLYMAFFSPFILRKVSQNMSKSAADVIGDLRADEKIGVDHWVILPNFSEDVDILEATLRSVARSSLACSNINILLAMEEREAEAGKKKSNDLEAMFQGKFKEIFTVVHPMGLPNDPPGKASNVSHAFKELLKHLSRHGQDLSRVMLTIADADSEFHEIYFEMLTRQHLELKVEQRNTTIWQSAILHAKNYHRQPAPVLVGTMFTCITELSFLADPNGIRFPYSTYSLPLVLAEKVGGWDADWIAEDWHMGIKCYLLTMGRCEVRPVAVPTLNYTPEGETWTQTCNERLKQAKRHALGFSDLAYYFMMLPLIFLHLTSVNRKDGKNLGDFWRIFFNGISRVVRLVNTHAILGILTFYAVLDMLLKQAMLIMGKSRSTESLLERTFFATSMFGIVSVITLTIVTINFQVVYSIVSERFERPKTEWSRWIFAHRLVHWMMTVASFLAWAPVFFFLLAYAVWAAAFRLLASREFVYEVAAKPTQQQRV
jgi:hypothetical protein